MNEDFLKLIMDELITIKTTMATKDDLQEVKDELKIVKDDLQGVKDDLQGVKNDLQGVKDDLQGVKNTMATKEDLEAIKEFMVTKEEFNPVKLAVIELSDKVNYIMDNMATKDNLRYIEFKLQENEKENFKLKELVSTLTTED